MKISYNWLKWYIDGELPIPEKLADVLTFKLCEVEGIEKLSDGDSILDLNILPNRAHDLLSHHGVAREVAGLLGFKFKDPTSLYKDPENVLPTQLKIEITTENCRRYMGRIVRNIKVGPSPEWVVKHLESIGQRSINNIVDATNLVMFDCGQPCHAFDLSKVSGSKIVVTHGKEGEEFPVLGRDKIVAKLKEYDVVIADGTGETLAIAGVKGGLSSGVIDTTTDIILEVANFDPVSVRKTARRLNLLSDSSKRFENNLSPEHVAFAMKELTGLLIEMCPEAIFEEIVDIYPKPEESRTITFSIAKINKYLGTKLKEEEMVALLTRYGYEVGGTGDVRVLSVPPLRYDILGVHDIAEEVARIYGLENIEAKLPSLNITPTLDTTYARVTLAREKLIAEGYREVITYAFRKKGAFEVARGVGDKSALRTNLTDGFKESYELNRLNAPILGIQEVKLFEIGTVFPKEGESIHVVFGDKKGITEMTLESYITEAPSQYKETEPFSFHPFTMWSLYPAIVRDIALWVSEGVTKENVIAEIDKVKSNLIVRGPDCIDEFKKDGKTSYAFRLVFQAEDRTLTDEEVNEGMKKIVEALTTQNWEVR